MQVMRDIYMLLGPPYANIANVFAIKHNDALVIIDTAETEPEYRIIKENMKQWGLDRCTVSHILLSHKHLNHIGNLNRFKQDYPDLKVVAGIRDADSIENGDINEICDFDPFPAKETYTPVKVDLRVKDGDRFEAAGNMFTVYEVPGHTAGSVFYQFEHEEQSVWLTGDVLNMAGDCMGAHLGFEGAVDFSRKEFFESIKRFSKFKGDIILPGHFQMCLGGATRIFNDAYRVALEAWRKPAIGKE